MSSSEQRCPLRYWIALLSILLTLAAPAARAEIVLVTAIDSTISELSRDEAEQLYMGRRATVSAHGALLLLDLPTGPIRDQFYYLLTGKNPSQIRAYWSRMVFTGRALPPTESADVSDAYRMLMENPNAIAYLPSTYAKDPGLRVLLRLE